MPSRPIEEDYLKEVEREARFQNSVADEFARKAKDLDQIGQSHFADALRSISRHLRSQAMIKEAKAGAVHGNE